MWQDVDLKMAIKKTCVLIEMEYMFRFVHNQELCSLGSEMVLNYWVIVERYPFSEWSGWWIYSRREIFSLLDGGKTSYAGRKPKAHPLQGRQ